MPVRSVSSSPFTGNTSDVRTPSGASAVTKAPNPFAGLPVVPREQQSFRAYPSLDRYLDYSPGYDDRYELLPGPQGLLTRSQLWLMRSLPLVQNPYKQECSVLLKRSGHNQQPIEQARELLSNAESYLRQQEAISRDGWLTLSHRLNRLIKEDVKRRSAQKGKAEAPKAEAGLLSAFAGLIEILDDETCDELHAFAVTAYKDCPALQTEGEVSSAVQHESLQATYQVLIRYTAKKILENSALNNLRLYFKNSSQYRSPKNEFILSPLEARLLTEAVSRTQESSAKIDFLRCLFTNEISLSGLRQDAYGNAVVHFSQLMEESKLALNEDFSNLQKDNQQNIRSVFQFVEDTAKTVEGLQPELVAWVIDFLIEQPMGPILSALLKFLSRLEVSEAQTERLIDLMDERAFRHYRLLLAARLYPMARRYPHLLSLLEEKLDTYGIDKNSMNQFAIRQPKALRARLTETVFGPLKLKNALLKQLDWQDKDSAHVPLLHFVGPAGSGKTVFAEKLAVELNTTLYLQETCTNPEIFEGESSYHHLFNLVRLRLDRLAQLGDLSKFKLKVNEIMYNAATQARKFPGRPLVLVFDSLESLGQGHEPSTDVEQVKFMARVLLDLINQRTFFNPFTGEEVLFNNPYLILTQNKHIATAEDSLEAAAFDLPIFNNEVVGYYGEELKAMLCRGNTLATQALSQADLRKLMEHWAKTVIPALVAARSARLEVTKGIYGSLAKHYALKKYTGREVVRHLYHNLIIGLKQVSLKPGQTIRVSVLNATQQTTADPSSEGFQAADGSNPSLKTPLFQLQVL
ncbi:MAG: ATP-binding protein [Candidatus Melainabacteria bacterium]|nr:ATP-binding protein [Candidatus Melainabacteria bacterium]